MRILVLGAGGIGGYFGAKIHAAGGDVTFLVRPARAELLHKNGLAVRSVLGELIITPQIVTSDELTAPFDVIMLSCKAYDLESAMTAIAPAVGEKSLVLPLLNGVRHVDRLVERFGSERVLGGVAFISVALMPNGEIHHLNTLHRLFAGSRTAQQPPLLASLAQQLGKSGFEFVLSETIEQAMWDKFAFLTTLAGATCLFRASIGQILQTVGGEDFIKDLLGECAAVATACGHPLAEAQLAAYRQTLTDHSSVLMASMLRDIERSGPTEANHILDDMLARGAASGIHTPCLRLACSHLQAYEIRRKAETGRTA